jgi:hypothetical protein
MNNSAKFWLNNGWIIFNLNFGLYSNIIEFFNQHDISIIETNYIDFSTIPIALHGFGNSQNLLEYLSKNSADNKLIINFLKYYLGVLNFRYYYTDEKIVLEIINSDSWQTSTINVPNAPVKQKLTVDSLKFSADSTKISADLTMF